MKYLSITAIFVSGLMAASTSFAQDYTIKLAATAAPTESDPEYAALKVFEEKLETETNGKIDVQIYPANQLGGPREYAEAVSLGSVEMGNAGYDIIGSFAPIANALSMPYLHDSLDHYVSVIESDIGQGIHDKIAEQSSLRVVGVLWRGARQMMTGDHEVRAPSDLGGLRIRAPESNLMADTVRAMGAQPVPMSWSEVYTALSTGAIDGVENPLDVLASGNMHEVQSNMTLTNHIFLGNPLLINEQLFQSFPEDIRQAVLTAGKAASDARLESLQQSEKASMEVIKAAGVNVHDVELSVFAEQIPPVWSQYIDGENITQDLIDEIRHY